MATENLSGAAAPSILVQFHETMEGAVARSAIHEIGELSILVRHINTTTDDDFKRDALIRGMLVRIEDLAQAAMSCIDPTFSGEPVESLRAFVECDETGHHFGARPVMGGAS